MTMKVRLALVQLPDDGVARQSGPLAAGTGMARHESVDARLVGMVEIVPTVTLFAQYWLAVWQWAWLPFVQSPWHAELREHPPSAMTDDTAARCAGPVSCE
jgi:hypothetical protein